MLLTMMQGPMSAPISCAFETDLPVVPESADADRFDRRGAGRELPSTHPSDSSPCRVREGCPGSVTGTWLSRIIRARRFPPSILSGGTRLCSDAQLLLDPFDMTQHIDRARESGWCRLRRGNRAPDRDLVFGRKSPGQRTALRSGVSTMSWRRARALSIYHT